MEEIFIGVERTTFLSATNCVVALVSTRPTAGESVIGFKFVTPEGGILEVEVIPALSLLEASVN